VAYDFALDANTGDFVFGPNRDILGATGPQLDMQRISIRCKIPKGTFTYDEDGILGSLLYLIPRNPSPARQEEAKAYVREALEDADGITVDNVELRVEEDGALSIDVQFTQTSTLGIEEDEGFEEDDELPEFDANVRFSHLE
jgi:hypothetical protein